MSDKAGRLPGWALGIGAVGLIFMIVSLRVGKHPVERFFANWVVWFTSLLSVGLGALFMVALEHLVGARWSVPLRRVPERVSGLLWPLVGVAAIGLLAFAGPHPLYRWALPSAATDPILGPKLIYLNVPFFAGRVALCFVLWALFHTWLVRGSYRQDETRDPAFNARAKKLSAIFMLVFAPTLSIIAFDWLMSLDPYWFSTIFGVYLFAGTMTSGLAAITLGVLWMQGKKRLPGIGPDHLYSLGGLMFAFTCFWAYIAISQFMLIWYANIPEEAVWYVDRTGAGWIGWGVLLVFMQFLVPFFALLQRDSKCDPARLRWVSIWLLAAHVVDMYYLVMPTLEQGVLFGLAEIGFLLFFPVAAVWWVARSMAQGADMPTGDPNLAKGLEFHL